MTAAQARAAFDQAGDFTPEPPRPLLRGSAPPDPFPIDVLGGVLQGAAEAIVDKVQCPAALAGQSVLAGATLATQGHADVELHHGHAAPLSSFLVTVAETASARTAPTSTRSSRSAGARRRCGRGTPVTSQPTGTVSMGGKRSGGASSRTGRNLSPRGAAPWTASVRRPPHPRRRC